MFWTNSAFLTMLVAIVAIIMCITTGSTEKLAFATLMPEKFTHKEAVDKSLTVVATLYDVKNTTGNVVVFFALPNTSVGRIVNASSDDVSDGSPDGIVDVILGINNSTIRAGQGLQVCAMPFNEQKLICSSRHNAPGLRYEYVDFSLSNDTK